LGDRKGIQPVKTSASKLLGKVVHNKRVGNPVDNPTCLFQKGYEEFWTFP